MPPPSSKACRVDDRPCGGPDRVGHESDRPPRRRRCRMGEDAESPKTRLRRELDARRKGVAAVELARASGVICERIEEAAVLHGARHLVLYAARPDEIDPSSLEARANGTS